MSAFKQEHSDVADNMTAVNLDIAASSIASKRVVNRVLQLRNKYAGALLDQPLKSDIWFQILVINSLQE